MEPIDVAFGGEVGAEDIIDSYFLLEPEHQVMIEKYLLKLSWFMEVERGNNVSNYLQHVSIITILYKFVIIDL